MKRTAVRYTLLAFSGFMAVSNMNWAQKMQHDGEYVFMGFGILFALVFLVIGGDQILRRGR